MTDGPDDRLDVIQPYAGSINVNVFHDVRMWMTTLGCTEPELRGAVREVGASAAAVRNYLHMTK